MKSVAGMRDKEVSIEVKSYKQKRKEASLNSRNLTRSVWISIGTIPILLSLILSYLMNMSIHLQILQIVGAALLHTVNRYLPDLYLTVPTLVANTAYVIWVYVTKVYLHVSNLVLVFITCVWMVFSVYRGDLKKRVFKVKSRVE